MADSPEKPSPEKPCPVCAKPATPRYRPFCSSRCADVDLHRWLGGQYAIPAEEEDTPGEDESEPGETTRH
jgi:endogenous inhibitor of DNA gyrase (YacG/DUF329 family)